MTSLFDLNKLSLKKLYHFHEKEGLLKFTDLLKLCSTTRVFPDLLSSSDLHRILIEVAKDPETQTISQNLTFSQFEHFLRQSAKKSFEDKAEPDQEKLLFNHLKSSCNLRYSVDFETSTTERKTIKKIPKLSIDPVKVTKEAPKSSRRSFTNLNSARSLKSSSFLLKKTPQKIEKTHKVHNSSIVSPRLIKQKSIPKTIIKPLLSERVQKLSFQATRSFASPVIKSNVSVRLEKLAMILGKMKNRDLTNEVRDVKSRRFIKIMEIIQRKIRFNALKCRLCFAIWGVLTKTRRFDMKDVYNVVN